MNFSIKSKAITLILGFSLLFAGLSGCERKKANSSSDGGKKTVGFSQMENTGPWRIAETNSMKDEAAKRADKYNYVYTDAQSQTAKQISDVEDLIARKVDAIFLAPREAEGFSAAFQ